MCNVEFYFEFYVDFQVAQGPGLTFIAFTEAISWMDVKPLWSLMFFLMLMTLGMGSMIGTFECVRTTIVDLQIIPLRKEFVTGGRSMMILRCPI